MLRKILALAICFLLLGPGASFAQIPQEQEVQQKKTADKKFWIVNSLMIGSTIYDVESTYFALDRCKRCRESNPLIRPFIKAGRPAIYTVQGSIDVGAVYLDHKLKKKGNKLWWLLPVVLTVSHTAAGTHNVRIALRF